MEQIKKGLTKMDKAESVCNAEYCLTCWSQIKKGFNTVKLDNGKGEFVDAEYCLTCWKYVLLAGINK